VGGFPPQPIVGLVQQWQQCRHGGMYGLICGQRPRAILVLVTGRVGGLAQLVESDDAVGQASLVIPDGRVGQQIHDPSPVVGVGRGGQLDQKRDGWRGRRVAGALVDDREAQLVHRVLAGLRVGGAHLAQQPRHILSRPVGMSQRGPVDRVQPLQHPRSLSRFVVSRCSCTPRQATRRRGQDTNAGCRRPLSAT
jgi:hypothetical protein